MSRNPAPSFWAALQPGILVKTRGRVWVVQPSEDPENLLLLAPLDGAEQESIGLYWPVEQAKCKKLQGHHKEWLVKTTHFPLPSAAQLGSAEDLRVLFEAARLSFRSAGGPFRCMGRLSFRPRAYQMVPLVMALKLDTVRMLIADDVGVGKTLEALLIARELLARRRVRRLAVICPPHLCDQWQAEIRDKFSLEAEILRTNTQSALERQLLGDEMLYDKFPILVISIDFIKAESRRRAFLGRAPELVIVDEAHTVAKPKGQSPGQQQRHALVAELARDKARHLILLTATPHSGKHEEFLSLLGLIRPEFEQWADDWSEPQRKELARHYIQRKRADVMRWAGENVSFPRRDSNELIYSGDGLSADVFRRATAIAREVIGRTQGNASSPLARGAYWTALSLFRGISSSPAAGLAMIDNRLQEVERRKAAQNEPSEAPAAERPDDELSEEGWYNHNRFSQDEDAQDDDQEAARLYLSLESERGQLEALRLRLEEMALDKGDIKLRKLLATLETWLREGRHPVVFCRFISTAKYVAERIRGAMGSGFKDLEVQAVTSEMVDEERKAKVAEMALHSQRVLVATDCLSEGINLQDAFNAVVHYDLPWNPNRLEQREGRVDRFGQKAPVVKSLLIYCQDNLIDTTVFEVIIKKIKDIRKATGVTIALPEMEIQLMDSLSKALFAQGQSPSQLSLFDQAKETVGQALGKASERDKQSRGLFAQNGIRAEQIEDDLRELDNSIGTPKSIEQFVGMAAPKFRIELGSRRDGRISLAFHNAQPALAEPFRRGDQATPQRVAVCFDSPTPEGHSYLGRNHPFVEALARACLSQANGIDGKALPRVAVFRSSKVEAQCLLLLLRVRMRIESKADGQVILAEEMLIKACRGLPSEGQWLPDDLASDIFHNARPESGQLAAIDREERQRLAREILAAFEANTANAQMQAFEAIARERAEALVRSHQRYSGLTARPELFVPVEPVLPIDLLGLAILLPKPAQAAPDFSPTLF